MSSAERIGRKGKKETIRHKTTATIFACLLLSGTLLTTINAMASSLGRGIGIFAKILVYAVISYGISYLAGVALSRKYVGQIAKMTDEAKAIAISKNLERRISISGHPDELSNLESAFNDMLFKLEESFERERRFVSDASHELRTPVAVMKGYLDIARGWGRDDPKLIDESLEALSEETDRMKRLIDDLLRLARMDRDDFELNVESIESGCLIEKMREDGENVRKGRTVGIAKAESFHVKGDMDLILECLRALFENAVDYTDENGTIILSAETRGKMGCISVADDGMGIAQEDIGRIFGRFSRTESSRRVNPSGSGLGLSLVKSIVEAQGGRVEVESEVGKGSTFTISLPLAGNRDSKETLK